MKLYCFSVYVRDIKLFYTGFYLSEDIGNACYYLKEEIANIKLRTLKQTDKKDFNIQNLNVERVDIHE